MDLLLHNLRTIGTHHCDQTVGEEAAQEIERLREALKIASTAVGDFLRTGKEAAEVLRTEAEVLRQCSTVDGTWDGTEQESQEEYERFMAMADRLTPPMSPPNAELCRRWKRRTEMTDYKSMFEQAVRTLAAIDEALGIGDDGCGDPDQTLTAIAELKAAKVGADRTATVTREMIGAAHDVMLAKGDFVLSARLLEQIYLAMDQAAPPPQTPFDTCPTCEALARTVMMDQTGAA